MSNANFNFAKRFKELRESKHKTQEEIALELSVSKSTIAMWETNKRLPDLETVMDIADVFDIDLDSLLCRNITNNSPCIENKQNTIFINNVKHYLLVNNKSQKDVSCAIGVPVSTFSTWMVGKAFPRMTKLQALADYFGCTISDLIEEKGSSLELTDDEEMIIKIYRTKNPVYTIPIDVVLHTYREVEYGNS